MTDRRTNLAASVAARLLNRAKQSGDDYQTLLTGDCFERFLYRLGTSSVRDRFVLKGAMLFRVWSEQPYRATRDLDLLHRGDNSFDGIRNDIRTICATLAVPGEPADEFVKMLGMFLLPILDDLRRDAPRDGIWRVSGPWQ